MSYKKTSFSLETSLFKDLKPFGGKLNENNRWIKLKTLIPWKDLEQDYKKYHSSKGRPAKSSDLINGLLIIKHLKNLSDKEVVEYFLENPYVQYFCGFESFVDDKIVESSTLTKVRKRLGEKYFKDFESKLIKDLLEKKLIKPKDQLVDATVYESKIKYPTDAGLLNTIRQWSIKQIKTISKKINFSGKIRTYKRVARKLFLNFSKKKRKTRKEIKKVVKKMHQYASRNFKQLEKLIDLSRKKGFQVSQKILKNLQTGKEILFQQLSLIKEKGKKVEGRIISFWHKDVRAIVRGKSGKKVEFGPKANLSYVDGYTFLNDFSHKNYNEGLYLENSLNQYKEKFKVYPKVVITDKIYGNLKNRNMLKSKSIKSSLVPLGKKTKLSKEQEKFNKKKQKERNRIEGVIGTSKEFFGLRKLKYKDELQNIRMSLLAMNLNVALKRI